MPWNEPGSGKKDPWGNRNRNSGGNPDIEEVINNVRKRFGGGSGGSGGGRSGLAFPQIALVVLALLIFWGFRSVYTVQEGFESIELRFGKYHETVGAGLQFVMWPIESNIVINSKNVRTVEVGFRKAGGTSRSVRAEAQMLTTDENIADVSLAVQYNIRNVEDLLFQVGSVEQAGMIEQVVRGATESALREVVGSTTMDDLFNRGRTIVEIRTKELLQQVLDRYQTGINVIAIEMQAAQPPQEVRTAFDNVNRADQLEQQLIKEAKAYEEKVTLQAEGQAARLLATAEGYKESTIAKAEGETQRFTQILTEYQKAPKITRTRLYIETMEEVLGNTNKILIDQEGGNNMMYLPLDQIMRNTPRERISSSGGSLSTPAEQAQEAADAVRRGR